MTSLYFGNFDFEHRLPVTADGTQSARGNRSLPEAVRRLNAELACVWAAIANDGDLLRLPVPVEAGFFDALAEAGLPRLQPIFDGDRSERWPVVDEVVPWGWSDDLREWADRRGLSYLAPAPEIVARANSRRFSTAMENELGMAVPGTAAVRSLDELEKCLHGLESHRGRWVVKAEYGMSSRERMIGSGPAPDRRTADWVRLRIARDGAVYFEPWLEVLEQAGLCFTISPDGDQNFDGLTEMISDEWGRYAGSRFEYDALREVRWKEAIEAGKFVAQRLAAEGYFGPLGIDACFFRDSAGIVRLRPVQDINARHTMGGLALGFRRLLKNGQRGTWLHVPWPSDAPDAPRIAWEEFLANLPHGTRATRTSPFEVGGRPNMHGTIVVISEDSTVLAEAHGSPSSSI